MNAHLYSKLLLTLKNGKDAVLIRIVHRKGSAPRGVGSGCFVDSDGRLWGTIGGGLLEYRAVERAMDLFDKQVNYLNTITMTSEEIEKEGMICGGSVELFYEPILHVDKHAVAFFTAIDTISQAGQRGTFVTLVRDAADCMEPNSRLLFVEGGEVIGKIPNVKVDQLATSPRLETQDGTPGRLFFEPIVQDPQLLVFGGGHISTCVSPLAKNLGFHVSIFDDRNDFANKGRFPEADEIFAMPYPEAFGNITITGTSYIVIVTRGHREDRAVLDLTLKAKNSPAYVGMIGSIRKRDRIFKTLLENGISQENIDKVYSPIGLDIAAQTPEEIAVSIMAEIIRVKAIGN